MSATLSKSWPATARNILLDTTRFFYRQMSEPFAVYDIHLDEAVESVNREIERRQREVYEEASPRWIDKWESGKLDPEIKKAIEDTYSKLRRAERGIRGHSTTKKAKSRPKQLDVEIAQALSKSRR